MMLVMPHRGPDGDGEWQDQNGNYLGYLRLSIVDLSGGGQPLTSVDGSIVVVFNGEIYNHRELRSELEGRRSTLIYLVGRRSIGFCRYPLKRHFRIEFKLFFAMFSKRFFIHLENMLVSRFIVCVRPVSL